MHPLPRRDIDNGRPTFHSICKALMSASNPSSVKATKKSAFSCDPCRRRKVKCKGEQPSCSRCITRGDVCLYKLSPTLTYTEKLENRVNELEILLSEQRKSSPRSIFEAPPITRTPGESTISNVPSTFEGLKLDDHGGITYHGATSFFQLPTHSNQDVDPDGKLMSISSSVVGGDSRRDKLVSNAWQQRALETLSETPVSPADQVIIAE
jgi:hypothetical protein